VYAIERSSRVFSGLLLRTSILPPTCSENVRSVVSRTRAPATASTAAVSRGQSEASPVSTVMSHRVLALDLDQIDGPDRPAGLADR
jgi:hypothetical protein